MGLILVLVTFPDEKSANNIVDEVLERKLAGCILTTEVSSAYFWQNEKQNDEEMVSLFKTNDSNIDNLEKYILENHPYEVPAMIKLNASANTDYENWLTSNIS
jgi:periplasmic divalent cation tolerance protein